jgi:hypothetical protein
MKLNASTTVGLFILMGVLTAMVSIAVMQIVRTVSDLGPKIYIVGGAIVLAGALIPVMLVIMINHMRRIS